MFGANAIMLWPNHARAEFVKNLKRGFVTGKAELPLELQGGLAGGLSRDEIRTPEPG